MKCGLVRTCLLITFLLLTTASVSVADSFGFDQSRGSSTEQSQEGAPLTLAAIERQLAAIEEASAEAQRKLLESIEAGKQVTQEKVTAEREKIDGLVEALKRDVYEAKGRQEAKLDRASKKAWKDIERSIDTFENRSKKIFKKLYRKSLPPK